MYQFTLNKGIEIYQSLCQKVPADPLFAHKPDIGKRFTFVFLCISLYNISTVFNQTCTRSF